MSGTLECVRNLWPDPVRFRTEGRRGVSSGRPAGLQAVMLDYRPPTGDGSDSAVLSGRWGATGFSESGIAEGSA